MTSISFISWCSVSWVRHNVPLIVIVPNYVLALHVPGCSAGHSFCEDSHYNLPVDWGQTDQPVIPQIVLFKEWHNPHLFSIIRTIPQLPLPFKGDGQQPSSDVAHLKIQLYSPTTGIAITLLFHIFMRSNLYAMVVNLMQQNVECHIRCLGLGFFVIVKKTVI